MLIFHQFKDIRIYFGLGVLPNVFGRLKTKDNFECEGQRTVRAHLNFVWIYFLSKIPCMCFHDCHLGLNTDLELCLTLVELIFCLSWVFVWLPSWQMSSVRHAMHHNLLDTGSYSYSLCEAAAVTVTVYVRLLPLGFTQATERKTLPAGSFIILWNLRNGNTVTTIQLGHLVDHRPILDLI